MSVVLLDLEDPSKVDYEVDGFFGNVVFSCGVLVEATL
jgi:beta-1,2-mannobiose phosphorylase / 1,2-beta-oligomannan phosphorylase